MTVSRLLFFFKASLIFNLVIKKASAYLFEPEDLYISDVVDGALAVLTVRKMLVMA